ncbi:MAG: DoxX family protein, partial [Gemmataceae bacterium]
IFFGFCTRLACLMAAGFLISTYLLHPPFPWFPLPPGTEGNPLFINKNAIECFALFALACMPTGRWLGFDAILYRIYRAFV